MEPGYEVFMLARDELCARIVAERSRRFRRKIQGQHFIDDRTMFDVDADLVEAPPMAFHLIYKDANGALTGREFKLYRLAKKNNDITVGGVCFLRSKYRQFLASRMVEVTDLSTGEIVNDGVAFFGGHPILGDGDGRYRTPEEEAIRAVRDEIVILTFVAASDGDIHADEMDVILKFVANPYPDRLNETILAARIAAFVPDSAAFRRALDRLCQKPGRARPLERALAAVMYADRRVHENEQLFVGYVCERLREAGKL